MCAFFTLYEESLLQAQQLYWQIGVTVPSVPFEKCKTFFSWSRCRQCPYRYNLSNIRKRNWIGYIYTGAPSNGTSNDNKIVKSMLLTSWEGKNILKIGQPYTLLYFMEEEYDIKKKILCLGIVRKKLLFTVRIFDTENTV